MTVDTLVRYGTAQGIALPFPHCEPWADGGASAHPWSDTRQEENLAYRRAAGIVWGVPEAHDQLPLGENGP